MTSRTGRGGATRVPPGRSVAGDPDKAGADQFDRHVFFSADGAPGSGSGPLAVECARCHTTTNVSAAAWMRAHAPLFVWVPAMRYSRWARCPACGHRSWVRLTLAR